MVSKRKNKQVAEPKVQSASKRARRTSLEKEDGIITKTSTTKKVDKSSKRSVQKNTTPAKNVRNVKTASPKTSPRVRSTKVSKPTHRSNKKAQVESFPVATPIRNHAEEWEKKAEYVLRDYIAKRNDLKPKGQSTNKSLTTECSNNYFRAYWSLPSLKHRDEVLPCYFRACIYEGYRDGWDWYQATMSVFSMHNETMCIWSHLLPFLCTAIAAVWLSSRMIYDGSTGIEQLMMGIFICTACTCLLLSSIYHWYGCMSEKHYYCLLSMDLGGIACLISGSFFPGVYYGFYCTPLLQQIYIGVTCLIFVIGVFVSIFGSKNSPNSAIIRQGGFAALTVFGFVPLFHWMVIAPAEYSREMIMGALGMFFFYGLGFAFLLTSFPESVWTNSYITTFLVPSHALWHLAVAAAIFTWLYTLLGAQQLVREKGCQEFIDHIDQLGIHFIAR